MYRIIDLSFTMNESALVPGHPNFTRIPITTHEEHGRSNTGMTQSMHAGTHVDSPYHFVPTGLTIDQVPLDQLFRPALKVDLRGALKAKGAVAREQLAAAVAALPGDNKLDGRFLMIQTGWMAFAGGYGTDMYYRDNWALSPEAAMWIVEQGVVGLALDFPPDWPTPGGPRHGDAPVHRILLGNGLVIVENLVNLELITESPFLFVAAPLKLQGFDGAAARAFAVEGLL